MTRTVTVADTTPPVITLLGEATVEIDQNTSYTDAVQLPLMRWMALWMLL